MSFAMDNFGLPDVLQKIQAGFYQPETIREPVTNVPVYQEIPDEMERVDLSENISARLAENEQVLEGAQVWKNIFEIAKDSLASMQEFLNAIKKQAENAPDNNWEEMTSAIKKNLANVQKIADSAKFKEMKLFDGSINYSNIGNFDVASVFKSASLKALGLPDIENIAINNRQEFDKFLQKLDNASANIQNRYENVVKYNNEIDKTVNNILVENSNYSASVSRVKDADIAAELKDTAVKGVLQNPGAAVKSQVKSLDEDVILALICLRL